MQAQLSLTELTLVVLFTLTAGICFSRLKQPPLLGYIISGILLGPAGLAYIHSPEVVEFLAELGIIFLMFVIGFELHLEYFKDIWKLAIGVTLLQILSAVGISFLLGIFWNRPSDYLVLIGFVLSLSSTSAVVKILESLNQMSSNNGQRAISILIAQDLAIVPMLFMIKNVSVGVFSIAIIVKIILLIVLIAGMIIFLSSKTNISLPFSRIVFRDIELVTLMAFACCVGGAWISGILGLSNAFGAFLVGLFLGNSEQQKILLNTIRPVQTLLVMIFFFSIGLLMDPTLVWNKIWLFIMLLFSLTIGKSIINIFILRLFRVSWSDALYIGILLAQIGEFSFILLKEAKNLKILTNEEERRIISLVVISLAFSPIWTKTTKRLKQIANVNITNFKIALEFTFGKRVGGYVYFIFYYLGPWWCSKLFRKKTISRDDAEL